MLLLYVSVGEGDGTPSFAQQSVVDQGTSIIGMATAAGDEEVPVSLCIIFENLKATLAYLEFFLVFSLPQYNYIH